jgi:hypothetical protein
LFFVTYRKITSAAAVDLNILELSQKVSIYQLLIFIRIRINSSNGIRFWIRKKAITICVTVFLEERLGSLVEEEPCSTFRARRLLGVIAVSGADNGGSGGFFWWITEAGLFKGVVSRLSGYWR